MAMQIDQATRPAGTPGQARRDGVVSEVVSLIDTTPGGQSYFQLWRVPDDDTTAVASLAQDPADSHLWTFTPDAEGPYRIYHRHTTVGGVVTEEIRIFGIEDINGVVPPCPGERAASNVTMANATDPAIIAKCERNWPTARWPLGNPWGYSVGAGGGGGGTLQDAFDAGNTITVPNSVNPVDSLVVFRDGGIIPALVASSQLNGSFSAIYGGTGADFGGGAAIITIPGNDSTPLQAAVSSAVLALYTGNAGNGADAANPDGANAGQAGYSLGAGGSALTGGSGGNGSPWVGSTGPGGDVTGSGTGGGGGDHAISLARGGNSDTGQAGGGGSFDEAAGPGGSALAPGGTAGPGGSIDRVGGDNGAATGGATVAAQTVSHLSPGGGSDTDTGNGGDGNALVIAFYGKGGDTSDPAGTAGRGGFTSILSGPGGDATGGGTGGDSGDLVIEPGAPGTGGAGNGTPGYLWLGESNTREVRLGRNKLTAHGALSGGLSGMSGVAGAWNCDLNTNAAYELVLDPGANTLDLLNPAEGVRGLIQVTQDALGTATLAWTCNGNAADIKWPNGAPLAVSLGASASDLFEFWSPDSVEVWVWRAGAAFA